MNLDLLSFVGVIFQTDQITDKIYKADEYPTDSLRKIAAYIYNNNSAVLQREAYKSGA